MPSPACVDFGMEKISRAPTIWAQNNNIEPELINSSLVAVDREALFLSGRGVILLLSVPSKMTYKSLET